MVHMKSTYLLETLFYVSVNIDTFLHTFPVINVTSVLHCTHTFYWSWPCLISCTWQKVLYSKPNGNKTDARLIFCEVCYWFTLTCSPMVNRRYVLFKSTV